MMTSALSLYLDMLRFGAAFTVLVSHFSAGRYSGGLLWQVMDYGRIAVLVFFVLSGFVIAWVTETRENSLEDYSLSRVARLYSVILPALVITAALDHFAMAIDPRLYAAQWNQSPTHAVLGFALSTVFLGASWTLSAQPGSNVPFWSLNYEAWYYVLFAAATFLRGRRGMAAMAGAALLAGPKILLLFPVWLMGVWAWRWRAAVRPRLGAPLAFAAVAGFITLQALGGRQLFWQPATQWVPPFFSLHDYIVGALVALLIVGLANARLPMPGAALERLIHGLAGTAFGLYLLHYPLLNFLGTVIPGPADRAMHQVLVFAFTLGGSIGLAQLIERQKGALKLALRSGLDRVRGRRRDSALRKRTAP